MGNCICYFVKKLPRKNEAKKISFGINEDKKRKNNF